MRTIEDRVENKLEKSKKRKGAFNNFNTGEDQMNSKISKVDYEKQLHAINEQMNNMSYLGTSENQGILESEPDNYRSSNAFFRPSEGRDRFEKGPNDDMNLKN